MIFFLGKKRKIPVGDGVKDKIGIALSSFLRKVDPIVVKVFRMTAGNRVPVDDRKILKFPAEIPDLLGIVKLPVVAGGESEHLTVSAEPHDLFAYRHIKRRIRAKTDHDRAEFHPSFQMILNDVIRRIKGTIFPGVHFSVWKCAKQICPGPQHDGVSDRQQRQIPCMYRFSPEGRIMFLGSAFRLNGNIGFLFFIQQ